MYLGAPPDPTDDQLATMIREALGPGSPGITSQSTGAPPGAHKPGWITESGQAGGGISGTGWLLLLGIGAGAILLLSRRR